MLKKILFIVLSLLLLQVFSFLLIGKRLLITSFDFSYNKFLLEKPPAVFLIYCNCGESAEAPESYSAHESKYENIPKLSEDEKLKLKLKLSSDFRSIIFVNHLQELKKFSDDRSVSYYLCIDNNSYFTAYVDETIQMKEQNHDSVVVSDWQSKYVWILFSWFKVKNVNLGVS